jgi:hypothetical protein
MRTINTSGKVNQDRRQFLRTAAITVGATVRHHRLCGRANRRGKTGKPADDQAGDKHVLWHTEADRCRRPDRGVRRGRLRRWLSGPSAARLALRHPQLCRRCAVASVGRLLGDRAISAGYGTTRFLSGETPRNGQQSVGAADIVCLMDALKIGKATIAGYD